jgi:hypothetical protein
VQRVHVALDGNARFATCARNELPDGARFDGVGLAADPASL